MINKNKLLKYCFYYYSSSVLMSALYFTAPKIVTIKTVEIAKEHTTTQKQIIKPLIVKK